MKIKVFDLTIRQINRICDKIYSCKDCPLNYTMCNLSFPFFTDREEDEIEVDEKMLEETKEL